MKFVGKIMTKLVLNHLITKVLFVRSFIIIQVKMIVLTAKKYNHKI